MVSAAVMKAWCPRNPHAAAPSDWTVAVDDVLTTRLRSCTVCGHTPEVLDIEVRRVGRLVLAVAKCLSCRNRDPAGQALEALLEARYGH
jgi:hypothetical protein